MKEVAEARGFRNASMLADALSLSYSTTYPLWKGTARRIDVSTLEKLCNLLRVHPGLLITLESEFSTADLPAPR
ncbi:MAG TPA: helix-turn-helix transcriptional regulator, partial [Blastocatellia bacterium]|nr:helix-turn-helix transcriptional regulator [Blastocatellia bacterium]